MLINKSWLSNWCSDITLFYVLKSSARNITFNWFCLIEFTFGGLKNERISWNLSYNNVENILFLGEIHFPLFSLSKSVVKIHFLWFSCFFIKNGLILLKNSLFFVSYHDICVVSRQKPPVFMCLITTQLVFDLCIPKMLYFNWKEGF